MERLKLGGDSKVEFKEVFFSEGVVRGPTREKIADELAAFGNTVGGTLIFSVSNTGEACSMTRQEMDSLEKYLFEICSDSISPPLAFLDQRVLLPTGQSVLVVDVEQSAHVHKTGSRYLYRQGSSTRELTPESLDRLFQLRRRVRLMGARSIDSRTNWEEFIGSRPNRTFFKFANN